MFILLYDLRFIELQDSDKVGTQTQRDTVKRVYIFKLTMIHWYNYCDKRYT